FQRELSADAALFVAAVGVAGLLAEALVDLHPTGFDGMGCSQGAANLMRPDISRKTVVTIVGHADHVFLVAPRDGHKYRAKDFLTCQPPVVGTICEDGWDGEIAFAKWPLSWRQTSEYKARIVSLQAIGYVTADLPKLLF